MRAGPLSNETVISLLNSSFVPVYVDGVYLSHNEAASADEKAAYRRLFEEFSRFNREAEAKGGAQTSIGSVHAYILTADGRAFDSLHVAEAKASRVIEMLRRAIEQLKPAAGGPATKPAAQSSAPQAPPGSLVLHLTARYLHVKPGEKEAPEEFVPVHTNALGTDRAGNWSDLPSENWIVLEPAEGQKFVPAGDLTVGRSWEIDRELATKIYLRFYPDTESNDFADNRIDRQSLRAKVVSVADGLARVQLEGELKMKHPFYPHREDDHFVDATVAGYLDYEIGPRRIRSLRLVTDEATYGSPRQTQHIGVALRSMP
ncbi:MAG TPA: hypothetical protein VJ783_08425 [Pirellulales bacterium]|nr:hypothetical protein [Pirellulales bacterium]